MILHCLHFFRELDLFAYAVQVIQKDVDRGWFTEVIHVSAEEAGSVKLGGDFKGFVNDVVHDDESN